MEYLLLLGSNEGNRAAHLQAAREAIADSASIIRLSRIHETAPWGVVDQPPFLNQAVVIDTPMEPEALLDVLKLIEAKEGRRPSGVRYGPRTLDIDILLWSGGVVEAERLKVPHPRMAERRFALHPASEVAGEWIVPVLEETVAGLLLRCPE